MPAMLYDDTIVAIATPPGEGGVGIVRLSGSDALLILERIFYPRRSGAWKPFHMRFGHICSQEGRPIDEALAVWMRAPHSFTGEDVAEISCHGGPLVLSRVLGRALECGARQATAGEFTMRAFLNGRIDLTQAEATLDVITARTETGLALAQAQLGGWLSSELNDIREILIEPLAYCTALVDFPEDELDPQHVAEPLAQGLARLLHLRATAERGIIYRQGARAVLVGLPNVGKSSLLNALLRTERAIVTPIPGTTRDTLEETANLAGIPVVLIDTAGITETDDPVEQIGVRRSRAALAAADIVLFVVAADTPLTAADSEIAALTAGKPTVLVVNKHDLFELRAGDTAARLEQLHERGMPFDAIVETSALTGDGIDRLAVVVAATLLGGVGSVGVEEAGVQLISNPRHRDAIQRAISHVEDASAGYERGAPPDLLAIDLTAALNALGEISGETVGDDLLDAIFSRFCIGK